ncbi:MAG: glycoside hydrolase family 6 protein, partial [Actinocrinis sp.]
MKSSGLKSALAVAAAVAALGAAPAAAGQVAGAHAVGHTLPSDARFYVAPGSDAAKQALTDVKAGHLHDALTMAKLASWPEATWFTSGTPAQVSQQVSTLMRGAAIERAVPTLVAYDIPLRDCGQYSSGGATSDAAYQQWIAAFAAAIGKARAVVILEPDALANLPQDCSATTDPTGTLTAARMADLRYAVSALEAQPATSVYLDAGNSQWHAVGDIAQRLIDANVADTQGFSLNVSNYQPTDQTDHYGSWVSKCIWFATEGPSWAVGHADWCASQYYSPSAPNDGLPGDSVSSTDPSTWHWTD